MMVNDSYDELSVRLSIHELIVEWWRDLDESGDYGSTNWEAVVPLRDSVTACLMCSPPRLDEAGHLTALARMLITGQMQDHELP